MANLIEKLVSDLRAYGDRADAELKRLRAENAALRRAAKPAPKPKGAARAR